MRDLINREQGEELLNFRADVPVHRLLIKSVGDPWPTCT